MLSPSGRVPRASEPNEWTRLRESLRAAGAPLHDLTETNPSRVGLVPEGAFEEFARVAAARISYDPDPRGIAAAREAVARRAAERGVGLHPDDVLLTSGTSEAYATVLRFLADPGDSILVPRPSYPLIEPIAAVEGVRARHYDLADEGVRRVDLGSLERAADARTRAVVVVQPNNPTGSWLEPREMDAVEAFCERRGLAILSDEVFGEFPWPGTPRPLPTFLGERRVPTFVFDGISKSCGRPGMKVAWITIAGPDADRAVSREGLAWIADLFLGVSAPAQHALAGWLAGRGAFREAALARVAENLSRLELLASRRPAIGRTAGGAGWSAVLRAPAVRSEDEWSLELLRRGVAVHPGHFYDFDAGAHLVVSLLPAPETFDAGIEALERFAAP